MPYPACFYIDDANGISKKDEYSYSPPGVMNVNLLAQGKPSFRQAFQKKSEDPNQEKPKKQLIFMDHQAAQWTKEDKAAIAKLRDQGFKISFWQNGYFIPFTHYSQLEDATLRHNISQIEDYEKVKQAFCSHYSLDEDECMIVDDYWLDVVRNDGKMPAHRVVMIRDGMQNIIPLFNNATPPVSQFLLNEYDNHPKPSGYPNKKDEKTSTDHGVELASDQCTVQVDVDGLLAGFVGSGITHPLDPTAKLNLLKVKRIDVDFDTIENIDLLINTAEWALGFDSDFTGVKRIVAEKDEQTKLFKVLEIEYAIEGQSEPFFLLVTETATKVTVDYRNCEFAAIHPPANTTHLVLTGCTLTLKELEEIVEKLPGLESLSLSGCVIKKNDNLIEMRRSLSTTLKDESWDEILARKKLSFENDYNLFKKLPVESEKNSTFNLMISSNQETKVLEEILKTPKIPLSLRSNVATPEKISKIKKLSFSNCEIQGDEFYSFLNKMQEATELTIDECNLPLFFSLPLMPKLNYLRAQSSLFVKASQLQRLGDAMPGLESLELIGDEEHPFEVELVYLNDLYQLRRLHLQNVGLRCYEGSENSCRDLTLMNVVTNQEDFNNVLQKFRRLEMLSLNQFEELCLEDLRQLEPKQLEPTPLHDLVTLNVRGKIHTKTLQRVIADATNLQHLDADLTDPNQLSDVTDQLNQKKILAVDLAVNEADEAQQELVEQVENSTIEFVRIHNQEQAAPKRGPLVSTSAPKASQDMDANTALDKDAVLDVQKIFYSIDGTEDPAPNVYRLEIFNDLIVNPNPCESKDAFKLHQKEDLQLEPCDVIQLESNSREKTNSLKSSNEIKYFYGEQHLYVDSHWRPIANLEAADKMLFYHLSKNMNVEVQYSKRDDQYYIRSTDGAADHVTLDFVLESPQKKMWVLGNLAAHYRNYGDQALKLSMPNPTGQDYLDAICKQKQGACRHRSVAFYYEIKDQAEIRIDRNQAHQLVEIKFDGTWYKLDLGGHPAKVNIHTASDVAKDVAKNVAKQDKPPSEKKAHSPRNIQLDDTNPYTKALSTWEKPSVTKQSTLEFFQSQFKGDSKQHLLECSSPQHILEMELGLEQYCKAAGKKVFYIDGPNDLVCAAPFIHRDGENGTLQENPTGGGPLHDFLTQHPDGVIIINYANFPKEAIVRNNVLLDFPNRVADGTKISKETTIIGLYDTSNPDRYQGSDFYSRMKRVRAPTDSSLKLEKEIFSNAESKKKPPFKINLYHDQDWETVLLGRWILQGNQLEYQPGKLQEALKQGYSHLQIENGLWGDPNFQLFWRQAKIRGEINVAGETIKIPADLQISTHSGYAFAESTNSLDIDLNINPKALTVNPALFSPLFYRYICDDNGKTLTTLPGIIEQHKGKTLEINLTHDLTRDQWGRLLQEAEAHQVKLKMHVSVNVKLPNFIPDPILYDDAEILQLPKHSRLITSTDRDVTKQSIIKNEKDWIVIDVSNCSPSDLISTITGKLKKDPLGFEFENDERVLTEALKQNKKILLHGKLSIELQQALTSVLVERMAEPVSGQLVIVSDKLDEMPFEKTHHTVSVQDKKMLLGQTPMVDSLIANESLARLQARERGEWLSPNNPDPWRGLYDLPNAPPLSENPDFRNSKQLADAFDRQRLHQLQAVLDISPFAYLAGATAVGKTTFMNTLMNVLPNVLFQGESDLLKWINDKTPQTQKILFIDEENISRLGWSMFEGLFNNPPSILLNGKIQFLTDDHKVVFAGNPANYGAGREVSSLFERHGNVVLFERLSQEYVYERLIKPIFKEQLSDDVVQSMSEHWLKVYRFLCACSQDEILISPREIQMMALMTLSYLKRMPEADPLEVAKHYAHFVTQQLVPGAMKEEFNQTFKPANQLPALPLPQSDQILMTPSRMKLMSQLQDVIALHEFRQNQATNNAQKQGGLGGFTIEGEPGIGKSDSVIALLRANQYREKHLNEPEQTTGSPEKIFYRMHASMLLETKKTLLLRAFREGAIVLADEMNSAANPELERLLNDLLMGKYKGDHSKNPGFLLIATQNPMSAGRTAASTAMARRCLASNAEDYPSAEKVDILIHKGVDPDKAKQMVAAFEMCYAKAVRERLSPVPTFRDLLKLVPPKIYVMMIDSQEKLDKWLQTHPTAEQASAQFKMPIDKLVFQFTQRYAIASVDDDETELSSLAASTPTEAWRRICETAENDASGLVKSILVKLAIPQAQEPLEHQQQAPRTT